MSSQCLRGRGVESAAASAKEFDLVKEIPSQHTEAVHALIAHVA